MFETPKYKYFTIVAIVILFLLNIYNFFYVKYSVASKDAKKRERLSQKKVKELADEYKKKLKRAAEYEKAMKREAAKAGK